MLPQWRFAFIERRGVRVAWRHALSLFQPGIPRFQPIFAKEIVTIGDQVGQRLMFLSGPVQVVLHIRIHIDVVEL